MKKILGLAILLLLVACASDDAIPTLTPSPHDLHFDELSQVWDEAIPLGNGMLGALIWEKEGKLRFSLDRADLWDLRPMENLQTPAWKYSWVYDQWKKDDYKPVQDQFDVPYDRSPAPSKIPGAALEFDISTWGEVASVHLYIDKAICEVKWKNGVKLVSFVHASDPIGWFRFEGLPQALTYKLIPPAYNSEAKSESASPVTGQDLRRLAYPKGSIVEDENSITYDQEGWGGFKYQASVLSEIDEDVLEGCWSISSTFPDWEKRPSAVEVTQKSGAQGMSQAFQTHQAWWANFWGKSDIQVPDTILQKQWYLEQYKFGSAARVGAPPISLQAVWTADNGKLPPWKGDFHHDLNTQLSYWPAYSANHLAEEIGFIDWLWKYKGNFKQYTAAYYEAEGLNVPGVSTLTGQPMGGWIQYALGPTVSAWLGQHFYLHWRYSMDRDFLAQKAYPWIKEVAIYLDDIAVLDEQGMRKLPISSSPEIHNNARDAWFSETTNFDLALIRWTYEKAAELATELGIEKEAEQWSERLASWPELAIDDKTGLMLAPNQPYEESHRHLSHQLGYHPLGLLDVSQGEAEQAIIQRTISTLDSIGSSAWVGYSFSWLGNLKARAFDGEGAAEILRLFATSFCLPNSFHVNGDQSGNGYSNFTYRPFTLEGNFAFAAGLQEMLIQSHTGVVQLFPAVPKAWEDIRIKQLRTEGAFLISAQREKGKVSQVEIHSTKGGDLKLKNPFGNNDFEGSKDYTLDEENNILLATSAGERITLKIQ